jgi:hypothetical protein
LLFIKDKVASRAPWKRRCLNAKRERKRKADILLQPLLSSKRQRGQIGAMSSILEEGDDDKAYLDLVLIYNIVRGYCSVINELWAY